MGGNNNMVQIKKKKTRSGDYYYLRADVGKRKEKYLGKRIPKNIDSIKKEFEIESKSEYWILENEKLKENFSNYRKKIPKNILEKEDEKFWLEYIYCTHRIEGSTLTLGDTYNLLQHEITPQKKGLRDIIETKKHAELYDEMLNFKKDISKKLILSWHEQMYYETDPNSAGVFRKDDVGSLLGKTEYVLGGDVEFEMNELIKWYNKNKKNMHPVELAFRFHKKFELIHPFVDGNGRLGRLLMNFILHKNKFPMINVKTSEKTRYINRLENSFLKNDELIFVEWAMSKYHRDYKKFLK